jgi:PAS domain-containing protein
VGAELVPDETFLRSEYYFDFARLYERRHMVGGVLGTSQVVPVGFFRGDDADPFGEREVRLLKALLPHVQRALELRARLSRDDETVSLTRAALDTLPVSVVMVDDGLKIRFANGPAQRRLGAPGAALSCVRPGPHPGAGVHLAARSRDETAALILEIHQKIRRGRSRGEEAARNDGGESIAHPGGIVIARSHRAFIGTPVFRRAMATKQSTERGAPYVLLDRVASLAMTGTPSKRTML